VIHARWLLHHCPNDGLTPSKQEGKGEKKGEQTNSEENAPRIDLLFATKKRTGDPHVPRLLAG
jgi:hypothetical protein